MNSESKKLYSFMRATRGNWRNSVYIACSFCPYTGQACDGHLLSANADGSPILFSQSLFEKLTGDIVDKDECVGILTRQAFESLYHMWLTWNTDFQNQCSILQVLQDQDKSAMLT